MQTCHNFLLSEKNNKTVKGLMKETPQSFLVTYLLLIAYRLAFHDVFCNVYFCKFSALLFNKLIVNANMSLQSGWDRDSQAKKGGMAGLTGKMSGKVGSEKLLGTLC